MKGFKKLPFNWRRRTMQELSGSELKVWLYLYWQSDKYDAVEESNKQISEATNLAVCTVKLAKKFLRENGWLISNREAYRNAEGEWVVPNLKAVFPQAGIQPTPRLNSSPTPRGGKQPYPRAEFPAAVNSALSSTYASMEESPTGLPVNTTNGKTARWRVEEAAVDGAAAAACLSVGAQPKTKTFVLSFYNRVHDQPLPVPNSPRWVEDFKSADYILRQVEYPNIAAQLLDWVLAHEKEKSGFSWREKTVNLKCLAQFCSRGWGEGLLKQFSQDTGITPDTCGGHEGVCRVCGKENPNIRAATDYHCFECWWGWQAKDQGTVTSGAP